MGLKAAAPVVLKNWRLVGLSRVKTQVSVALNFAGVKTTCSIAIEKSEVEAVLIFLAYRLMGLKNSFRFAQLWLTELLFFSLFFLSLTVKFENDLCKADKCSKMD